MKRLMTMTTVIAGLAMMAVPASADGFLSGNGPQSNANSSAEANGIGVGQGGNAHADGGNANQGQMQEQGQAQGQDQGQSQSSYNKAASIQGQSTANANNSDQNVTVEGDTSNYEAPAFAPALGALTGTTCMGSSGASGGWVGASLGFNTTWIDEECQRREAMKLIGSLPEDTEIHGVSTQKLLGEMAVGLTGVPEAIAAAKNADAGEDIASAEDHNIESQAEAGGNPAYCRSGSLASDETLIENCSNGEQLVANRSFF